MPTIRPVNRPANRARLARLPAIALLSGLVLAAPAMAQPALDRGRAAEARGDMRGAQLEFRNAIRAAPDSAVARAALARVSLALGDGETAESAARAALERGFDAGEGTALLLQSYVIRGRMEELLRDVPLREDAPPAVSGRVAAARAMAQIALGRRADAEASVAAALRLAPDRVEPQLAAAALASATGQRDAAAAAIARALAIAPDNSEALLQHATLLAGRGETAQSLAVFDRLLAREPANVSARLRRAELLIALGEPARAAADIDAALAVQPGNVLGTWLRVTQHVRAQDWQAAEAALQRLGPMVPNFPDGLLMQAVTRRGLGQTAQALDSAQRHVARQPDDPRGVKVLAALEMESGRPASAAAVLSRYATRGRPDVEVYELLARAETAAGRPRAAAAAITRASELAPDNAALLARLAASRLAVGDRLGAGAAAEASLARDPAQPGARELLAYAALAQGDVPAAQRAVAELSREARATEPVVLLEATIALARRDFGAARAGYEAALRAYPESLGARLGLARVLEQQGVAGEPERLLGEVLQRDPDNAEAANRLVGMAISGGPRAATARTALERAQAAAPGDAALATRLAAVLIRSGETARAVEILAAEPLQSRREGIGLLLLLAEARLAANQPAEAEAAARTALAEAPDAAAARRLLALIRVRAGDVRGAETLLEQGLRNRPADAVLQQTLVAIVREARGLDAALATADQIAARPDAMPAAGTLRGDLLLGAGRNEDAARAYAAMRQRAPSWQLAQREAVAWQRAGRLPEAAATLTAWIEREPDATAALAQLSQVDLAAGRTEQARERLEAVVRRAPLDAVSLNNLAWLLAERGDAEQVARAIELAERSWLLLPTPESADTLGYALFRSGRVAEALPLLREAAAMSMASAAPNRGITYRFARALKETGARDEAIGALQPILADATAFPERAEAERLMADLRGGR
jgi:putative PEP-CTERM system TPR-repeat lipoprotein